jgi:hypothetical protein
VGAYIKSDKFKEMNDYAQSKLRESNPQYKEYKKDREEYHLLSNNCGTFARDVADQDPNISKPSFILENTPPNIVQNYVDSGHEKIEYSGAPHGATPPTPKHSATPSKPGHAQPERSKPTRVGPHVNQKPLPHQQLHHHAHP